MMRMEKYLLAQREIERFHMIELEQTIVRMHLRRVTKAEVENVVVN